MTRPYCDQTRGTPITVSGGGTTAGIDFALSLGGRISGTVEEDGTHAPLTGVQVGLLDSSGNNVASAWTDASGAFLLQGGVPAGSYFVRTYNDLGHVDEVLDDVPCTADCALVGATPITVSVGAVSGGIDFLLRRGAQMTGTVRDATTSAGLAEVSIEVVTAGGTYVAYGYTDAGGAYVTNPGLPPGTYFVRTRNNRGYFNEVYDNLPCIQCCDLIGATACPSVA